MKKNATGTVIISFILIECRANFTDAYTKVSEKLATHLFAPVSFNVSFVASAIVL